ncbi:MAG: SET domain-containing protein [Pirellulales bacterium]|nr:SET domain-containing protein [Pirellulales bacterium]
MLLIETELRPSSIHGIGLFAIAPVAVGQVVWRFTEGFDLDLDPRALDRLGPRERARLLHYGYIDHVLNRYILCCDDARFINHSPSPNIASDRSGDPRGVDVAVREILPSDEITIDYESLETFEPDRVPLA